MVGIVILVPALLGPDRLGGSVVVARRGARRGRRIARFLPLRLLRGEVDVEPFLVLVVPDCFPVVKKRRRRLISCWFDLKEGGVD